MKVAVLDTTGATITSTVPAAREITLHDLMLHTSGLIYGGRGNTAVHKLYPEGSGRGGNDERLRISRQARAARRCSISPATAWDYGFGLDVLGLVIEKVAGRGSANISARTSSRRSA